MIMTTEVLPNQSKHYKGFKRLFVQLCAAIAIICVIFYTYIVTDQAGPTSTDTNRWSFRQLNQLGAPKKYVKERHVILLWTPYFGNKDWLPTTKELLCPVEECDVTSNRLSYNKSSAVIIHWRDIGIHDLPKCTAGSQCPLVVLFNKEAPSHTPLHSIEKINDKVHWTATYRRDSDVFAPYGKVVPRNDVVESFPDIKLNRSDICWLVSNCHTPSNREQYVNELKRFVNVKVYGRCGNLTCNYGHALQCYRLLSHHCKFYLSFENSLCKDYSTEKLYFAMMSDMVPIVLGGDDYARYLPEHSFINVEDYSSPKALAEYLQELNGNDSDYLSYFKWREKYRVQDSSYMWLCDLCEKLHKTELIDIRPHRNVIKWWFEDAECSSL